MRIELGSASHAASVDQRIRLQVPAVAGFEPKVDRDTGLIRTDRETGKQLHVGEMVGFGPTGAEVFVVTIAADTAPKIGRGDPVTVTGLVAMPWTTKEGDLRVAFRAESVAPLAATRAA